MTEQTDRLKQIRARLEAAQATDRPNSGPFRATPEEDTSYPAIFGPDGDQLAAVWGNLALGIDGDALAEFWAHAPQDVAWLLGEVERHQEDLRLASGELAIPVPSPGSDMGRLLSANILLRRENERLKRAVAKWDEHMPIFIGTIAAMADAQDNVSPAKIRLLVEDMIARLAEAKAARAALEPRND